MEKPKDWTHKDVTITDIRKVNNLYIISVDEKKVDPPLLVSDKIFNERLKLYFLKDAHRVSRDEILGVRWNMYITKGHYIKVVNNETQVFDMEPDKFYVSYLEIAGPLATFQSVCSKPLKEN